MDISISQIKKMIDACRQLADDLEDRITEETRPELPPPWLPPVGLPVPEEYPKGKVYKPGQYYCATLHDLTGKANGGYKHTGVDLNLAISPYGDVDRGQPVFAVADGEIMALDYSTKYLGCVILKII